MLTLLQTIGIDSEFCIVESLVTGLVDMFPDYLRPRRRAFTSFICLLLFILGLPMVTEGGAFIFQVSLLLGNQLFSCSAFKGSQLTLQLMDFYSASGIPILWCCFFQTIAIGWIFGAQKFANCVEQMTGYKPSMYWISSWGVLAPAVMGVNRPLIIYFFHSNAPILGSSFPDHLPLLLFHVATSQIWQGGLSYVRARFWIPHVLGLDVMDPRLCYLLSAHSTR